MNAFAYCALNKKNYFKSSSNFLFFSVSEVLPIPSIHPHVQSCSIPPTINSSQTKMFFFSVHNDFLLNFSFFINEHIRSISRKKAFLFSIIEYEILSPNSRNEKCSNLISSNTEKQKNCSLKTIFTKAFIQK